MKIQLVLITEYGTFYGEFLDVDQEQYDNIVSYSKEYYLSGFEMNLEDGGFAIFSPEMIKKSILKIDKIDNV
jgi:hypothetical protein